MKSMNLNNLILTRVTSGLDRVALIGNNERVSFSDLIGACIRMHGKSVVVFIKEPLSLVRTLVALDGSAEAICPISPTMDSKELYNLVSRNKFDAAVTDMNGEDLEVFKRLNVRVLKLSDVSVNTAKANEVPNQTTNWLVPTSGTTSEPKLVSHTLESLCTSSLRRKRNPADNQVWGQFYDMTRYAGYQVLFNSLLNGHTLVTSRLTDPIHQRVERYAGECVTHISATPSQWRKILMTGEAARALPLEQIVLGGEAADQQVLSGLSSVYPKARITHTYASTESGLGLSVSDRLAGFPMGFLNSPENPDSPAEISVRSGRLFLRTKSSADNYVDGTRLKDSQGWVDTGDLVSFEGDRFFVIGRESGIINVGGDKVNPERIRHKLLEHADVMQVHVFGKKNPITGMVLSANIQLHANVDEESAKASINLFIKENFQIKDRPRLIRYVDHIEVGITGKLGERI